MSKQQHTPGPWLAINGIPVGIEHIFIDSGAGVICRIGNDVSKRPLTDEDSSNARLIAAAPELLEALEDIFPDVEYAIDDMTGAYFLSEDQRIKVHAAIAKARGEV